MLCEYGCKKEASFQLKNGKWCCEKNHQSCSKIREKNRESNIGKIRSKEVKEKFKLRKRGTGMLDKKHSKETIEKFKEQRNGEKNSRYGVILSKETREKIRLSSLRFNGKDNPMYGKKHSKETKLKIGIKSKEKFLNPKYLERLKESWNVKPNKPETTLINLFKKLKLNYKYTGDKSFWINGKNPDFTSQTKKKVIEFFGDHWHGEEYNGENNKEHEENRIKHFNNNGYECLVIWEHNFNKLDEVVDIILKFDVGIKD